MNNTTRITLASLATAGLAFATAVPASAQALPKRPEEIQFQPLVYNPPKAADYRHVLSSGVVVFLAPSKELPLVDLTMTFRGGSYLEPADKVGLAGMTAAMLRTGGTESMAPNELDEKLDFLATNIAIQSRDTVSTASIDCLSSKFDESLALLMDMLRRPRLDEAKQKVALETALEKMKQRNDDAGPILDREWAMLMYGPDHFESRQATEASMRGITRDDMAAFAAKVFNPGNVVVSVSGDFEPKDMLAKLESAFADWPKGERMPVPPAPTATFAPGVYHIEKEIPQGKVFYGMRGITRDDPDFFAALVMNEILGGGGFTSRIMKTVRSDEGLAYSAGSRLEPGVYYPGEFRAGFQSKNATVMLALQLIRDEFEKMRRDGVTDEELRTAKSSFLETFPRTFESKSAMLGVFVSDEWTSRDPAYWQTYRANIERVTPADVKAVAERLLDPSKMAVFVVGDWDTIAPGDPNGRASLAKTFNDQAQELPLRDPMTMQPMK